MNFILSFATGRLSSLAKLSTFSSLFEVLLLSYTNFPYVIESIFWIFFSVEYVYLLMCQYYNFKIIDASQYSLLSRTACPPSLPFFFRVFLVFLYYYLVLTNCQVLKEELVIIVITIVID